MCLGSINEKSEVFIWHKECVRQGQVGGGAGATSLAEPTSDGRPLVGKPIFSRNQEVTLVGKCHS